MTYSLRIPHRRRSHPTIGPRCLRRLFGGARLKPRALAATGHHLRDALTRPLSRASQSSNREPYLRANSHRVRQNATTDATPQRCPILGRGVPKTAIAPTTSSQNGSTPTPGIASRTSPGKSSHCQPSTTNNRAAVTTSTAHPIGGAKLTKALTTSDTPAMPKASASRNTENLRGVETVVSVDRFSNSERTEGSDILTIALRLVGSGADDTPPSAPRNPKLCQLAVARVIFGPFAGCLLIPRQQQESRHPPTAALGHKQTEL